MNDETRKIIDETINRELGMSYDEFESLDFDEQQRLVEKNRRNKKSKSDDITVMIGSGEHSIFVKMKCGERYMLDDGTFVIAGDTPEQSRNILDDMIDDAIYSKPVAFVKKLKRKLNNRQQ